MRLRHFAILLVALSTSALACAGGDGSGRISVVTSFYPLEYLAARVGGDRVDITDLARPGVEPHDFEPTVADLKAIAEADVLVYNGLGLEPWIDRAVASTRGAGLVQVAAGEGISANVIREVLDEQGVVDRDPHVWLDPRYAALEAGAIRDALKQADPGGSDEYDRNAADLIAALESLDRRFEEGLASCRLDRFVTAHAAFGYLADRYGLHQIAITGINQEEPDAAQLARIVDTVRSTGVQYVLTEPGASPKIAVTLAREVGAQVVELDPIELRPQQASDDYLTRMDGNLDVLRQVLECDGP